MGRLVIGGALLLVCGLLFIIKGISEGDGSQVAFGLPGLLIGLGALVYFKMEQKGTGPK